MSTAFSSLTAKKAGGAIKWTHIEPIIHDDVVFEDNHANFYGPDIASFAQRLKEISAAEYAQRIASIQSLVGTQVSYSIIILLEAESFELKCS